MKTQKKLTGKTAIVTGGGSGIGRSVCQMLAKEGADVVVLDLNLDAATKTAEDILALGSTAIAHQCDVSHVANVNEVFNTILESRYIDILINNAGIAHIGNLENTTEDDLDRLYQVNVKGIYNTTSAVITSMKKRQSGSIVNLASIASSVGIPDRFAYSMTKGAVLTMTYSIAKDYIDYGIRCNCVSPARVHTPFVDDFIAKNYPGKEKEIFNALSKSQPIGRMGQADEVASLIAFLSSDQAAFITGSNFPIDGGFVTLNN